MILPFATLNVVVEALFRGKTQPEIPETEFTPFDLSYLKGMPRQASGRPGPAKSRPAPVYAPSVPFNSSQI